MCIPEYLKTKDLQLISNKSAIQCGRDFREIKALNNKAGRKSLITQAEVADFYGLSLEYIRSKLSGKAK